MPEATMNKDDGAVSRQHDVGTAGHVRDVQTESVAQSMNNLSDDEFGLRVTPLNRSHDLASNFG